MGKSKRAVAEVLATLLNATMTTFAIEVTYSYEIKECCLNKVSGMLVIELALMFVDKFEQSIVGVGGFRRSSCQPDGLVDL